MQWTNQISGFTLPHCTDFITVLLCEDPLAFLISYLHLPADCNIAGIMESPAPSAPELFYRVREAWRILLRRKIENWTNMKEMKEKVKEEVKEEM